MHMYIRKNYSAFLIFPTRNILPNIATAITKSAADFRQMAGGGADASRLSQRFNLPDEIVSVIPTDPYEQLDLARSVTSMAIASLGAEMGTLRQNLSEKDGIIKDLRDTVARLDGACRIANEDNARLLKEKDSLLLTVKKLSRDLGKLEAFKRHLMQSLNDDNLRTESVGIGSHDQPAQKASSKIDEKSDGYTSQNSYNNSPKSTVPKQDANALATIEQNASTGLTPRWHSASDSPTLLPSSPKAHFEQHGSLSSSQHSPATNSPRSMPGREFFRQARSRLSLEQFSAFLANVKEFNAQTQSREETLKKAEEIFGTDNKDLYFWFQGLLNSRAQ